ncbi:AMP-binding protein, partial [Aquimarina algiphila]
MYVIYTSGSTGNPKGCLINHLNVVRLIRNNNHSFDFNENDVWIMCHSVHFDFSVWEIFGALLYGGRLVIPDEIERKDFEKLSGLIFKYKVSVLNQTPMSFRLLSDHILDISGNEKVDSLRYLVFGGDKLDVSFLDLWIKSYPLDKVQAINMYGITETTIHVTFHRLIKEDIVTNPDKSIVGKPLPQTQVYILGSYDVLQPIGVVGEICVSG